MAASFKSISLLSISTMELKNEINTIKTAVNFFNLSGGNNYAFIRNILLKDALIHSHLIIIYSSDIRFGE
jgi:hypothetical protein